VLDVNDIQIQRASTFRLEGQVPFGNKNAIGISTAQSPSPSPPKNLVPPGDRPPTLATIFKMALQASKAKDGGVTPPKEPPSPMKGP
jgi:hypothetical protein